jgi:hypothetical protein
LKNREREGKGRKSRQPPRPSRPPCQRVTLSEPGLFASGQSSQVASPGLLPFLRHSTVPASPFVDLFVLASPYLYGHRTDLWRFVP